MYLGNSRMLLGKNTNQKVIGDWLAVAPSNASSGTYGINNGSGYCSEIFNGYLYVGGDVTQLINNTTTSTANNLIKYNLGNQNAVWENTLTSSEGSPVLSLRSIGDGDHLLINGSGYLYYLDDVNDLIGTLVVGGDLVLHTGISNTFTSIIINGTEYSHTSNNYKAVVSYFDAGEGYKIYNGNNKTLSSPDTEQTVQAYDSYVSSNTGGKILTLDSNGSFLSTSDGFTDYNTIDPNVYPNLFDGQYHQCMISIPQYQNKIYVAYNGGNRIGVFNYSEEEYQSQLNIPPINPTTLNTVVYNNINYLIVGGTDGIYFVNPEDLSVIKNTGMPVEDPTINSITVDSDSTIYVTGNFSFTDKNGVTAKNIAKFVPDASKLP